MLVMRFMNFGNRTSLVTEVLFAESLLASAEYLSVTSLPGLVDSFPACVFPVEL